MIIDEPLVDKEGWTGVAMEDAEETLVMISVGSETVTLDEPGKEAEVTSDETSDSAPRDVALDDSNVSEETSEFEKGVTLEDTADVESEADIVAGPDVLLEDTSDVVSEERLEDVDKPGVILDEGVDSSGDMDDSEEDVAEVSLVGDTETLDEPGELEDAEITPEETDESAELDDVEMTSEETDESVELYDAIEEAPEETDESVELEDGTEVTSEETDESAELDDGTEESPEETVTSDVADESDVILEDGADAEAEELSLVKLTGTELVTDELDKAIELLAYELGAFPEDDELKTAELRLIDGNSDDEAELDERELDSNVELDSTVELDSAEDEAELDSGAEDEAELDSDIEDETVLDSDDEAELDSVADDEAELDSVAEDEADSDTDDET